MYDGHAVAANLCCRQVGCRERGADAGLPHPLPRRCLGVQAVHVQMASREGLVGGCLAIMPGI